MSYLKYDKLEEDAEKLLKYAGEELDAEDMQSMRHLLTYALDTLDHVEEEHSLHELKDVDYIR